MGVSEKGTTHDNKNAVSLLRVAPLNGNDFFFNQVFFLSEPTHILPFSRMTSSSVIEVVSAA